MVQNSVKFHSYIRKYQNAEILYDRNESWLKFWTSSYYISVNSIIDQDKLNYTK